LEEVDKHITTCPQTAQAASREGKYLAKYINEMQQRKKKQGIENSKSGVELMTDYPPFSFKSEGTFAYIGNREAVAEVGGYDAGGFVTWFLYRSVYLSKQVSWRNKFSLASDWTKSLIFGRDISSAP
jgi:NADH:ubiquinone reductase (non-electrogenic)